MNCSLCNSKTRHKKQDYVHTSNIIGEVLVPAIELTECRGCGHVKLSSEACDEVRNFVAEQEQKAITTLPANGLISAGQAAGILQVTKQAFSKNSKLKKGFVYSVMIGEKRAYFRSSVELFKKTGDGRFPITRWNPSIPKTSVCTDAPVDQKWQ
ncbi:MAG: hypothetical protein V2I35_11020, partial [Desulfocapsaceae bacterium]|nr:hypothetical protein [Desulfocapsaceae bacterium]